MNAKELTFFESVMLVAGAGIGTGILTLPYAIDKIGIFGTLTALFAAYVGSALMYFVIADLTRNSSKPFDLIAILNEHLFSKRGKKPLSIAFFIVLVMLLLENLVVYIICAADVLSNITGLDPILAKCIFYLIAALVFMFGIKGIGFGEKLSVILIGVCVFTLTVLSLFDIKSEIKVGFGDHGTVFAIYGLFMFAFSAIFSVIQVCNHIKCQELTGKAIICGLSLNACITVLFAIATILGSNEVTEIATIGLSDGLGVWFIKPICSVLVLFAMLSSFWSSGLAFGDTVAGMFKIGPRASRVIASLPALLIAILLPLTLLEYIQLGAGALSLILIAVVIPAYRNAIRSHTRPLLLGKFSKSRILVALVCIFTVLMAISSLIPIE